MFKDVNPKQSFSDLEKNIIKFWKENKIFEKSISSREGGKDYIFYDGPPFATGLPHYGHILAGTMKDVVPRYWTMKGFKIERKFGWDCHGLPVEYEVEKELGISGRKDIEEKMGISEFCEKCRSIVLRFTKEWEETVERMERWVDFQDDYKTMDATYMESIWWVFSQLWEKGLIYQGHKAMHVCPRCITPLSNFEVTLGYQDVSDPSVIWKFKLKNEEKTYLLAWTTTPWSSLSTMGLSVGPDFDYVKVKVDDEYIIFVKDRLEFVMKGKEDYEIVEEFKGSKLAGLQYEPLTDFFKELPEVQSNKNVYHVFAADYVEVKEGTGIVTINGAYGEIDMEVAKKNELPIVMDVDMNGHFNDLAKTYAGMYVKDAQHKFIEDMWKINLVWHTEKYKHSYPHCWRCESPLLNYATSAWFVKIDKIKELMLTENAKIHWVPEHVGKGRFHEWLNNAKDWCISRNRFWGAPLPLWMSNDGDVVCIKSIVELEQLSGKKITDLHKHFVDKVEFTKNGKTYKRIPEVLDCWFESGAMPYAQMHYPFENKEKFESNFPAEFIAEGLDQTRGWFYTLVVLGVALFGVSPFKNVIVNGLVLAEDGKKMSKRLKNYPEPSIIFEKHGADALRFYLMNSPVVKAEPLRFSEKGVEEVVKKVLLPLWNSYSFFVTYANIDGWEQIPQTPFNKGASNKLDKWILSELQLLIEEVTEQMDKYDLQKALEPIAQFIDSLTNWYIRRSRRRFWKSENDLDKFEAYRTLHEILMKLCQIIAPFCPAIADEIYKNLTNEESVHLTNWPIVDGSLIDEALSGEVDLTRTIVTLGHNIRSQKNIKVRQPLQKVRVALPAKINFDLEVAVICEELNVKEIEFLTNAGDIAEYRVSVNARMLGPKYGQNVQHIIKAAKDGKFEILSDHKIKILEYILENEEFELGFKGKEGFDVASQAGIVVALDTEVTEDLRLEGVARDLVRIIQDMRKEASYKVDDRIVVSSQWSVVSDEMKKVYENFGEYIKKETLCSEFVSEGSFDIEKKIEIGEEIVVIKIAKSQ